MNNTTGQTSEHLSGSLFIIAAASGSGKTSLVKEIVGLDSDIMVSVSHTTRPAREYEQEGVHYFFIDQAQFKQMIKEKIFLEYAEVFGYCYGTSRAWVEQQLRSGMDVILEIDWQGAKQVRKEFPESVGIFILPPSYKVLRERLQLRNSDSEEVIEQRLQAANEEISHLFEFDYLVINDNFDHALTDIRHIILARRLRTRRQIRKHAKLLEDLLRNQ